jgi:DNA repair exonuclease SbcCD ATPase subunit
MDSWEGIKENV